MDTFASTCKAKEPSQVRARQRKEHEAFPSRREEPEREEGRRYYNPRRFNDEECRLKRRSR